MSALKEWIQKVEVEVPYLGASIGALKEVFQEVSDRLDRLENPPVHAVSQSPLPVEVPPPSTLYTGNTGHGHCYNCKFKEYTDDEEPCKSCINGDGLEKWQPKQAQEQGDAELCNDCPDAEDCCDAGPHECGKQAQAEPSSCDGCESQGDADKCEIQYAEPATEHGYACYKPKQAQEQGGEFGAVERPDIPSIPYPQAEQGGDDGLEELRLAGLKSLLDGADELLEEAEKRVEKNTAEHKRKDAEIADLRAALDLCEHNKADIAQAMKERLADEKTKREYYQSIVYDICNTIDAYNGKGAKRAICGTASAPSTEAQDTIRKMYARLAEAERINKSNCEAATADVAKILRLEDEVKELTAERDEYAKRLTGMQNEHGRVIKSSLDMMQMNIALKAENADLRKIFPAICAALDNGASCSSESSIEFLREIPAEVAAVVAELKKNYEEVLEDHDRLVRDIDVIMHGEHGAAKQASLCDLVGPIRNMVATNAELKKLLDEKTSKDEILLWMKNEAHAELARTKESIQKVYDESTKKLVDDMQKMYDDAVAVLRAENAALKSDHEVCNTLRHFFGEGLITDNLVKLHNRALKAEGRAQQITEENAELQAENAELKRQLNSEVKP